MMPNRKHASEKEKKKAAGEDGDLPHLAVSVLQTNKTELGQSGGFCYKHIFGTTSSHGDKGGLSCNLTSVLMYACMNVSMEW